jgi:hypothetical protein
MTTEKKEKKPAVVYGTGHRFLDPMNCGSTIAYRIIRDDWEDFSADVTLTDCNRKIEWHFDNQDTAVEKIDNAIEALHEFRKAFIAGRRQNHKKPDA